jgi:hypothetical protein
MFVTWIPMFWMGCVFPPPSCAAGYERDAAGQCQGVEATQETQDSGLETILVGVYSGDFAIEILASVAGAVIEDVCAGQVGIDLHDDVLSGEISCQFEGQVDVILQGERFLGSLNAVAADDGSLTGDLVLDLGLFGAFATPWTGMASLDTVVGNFDGETTFELESAGLSVPVVYNGGFQAQP